MEGPLKKTKNKKLSSHKKEPLKKIKSMTLKREDRFSRPCKISP